MRFGFGLITCQRPVWDSRSFEDLYREAIELCVLAENAGFDSVWTSEHHFVDDGYMSSPLTVSAAIAQATSRVEIGTGVTLAPLHDPLRLAQDAATIDLISGGRFTLGIGAGWRDEEYLHFGVDLSDRAARMVDTVNILRGAWGENTFSYDGRRTSVDRVNVTPKPAHPIPILMGGFAEAAIRRAGRIADGFLGSSSGTHGLEAFKKAKQVALEGRAAANKPAEGFRLDLHVPVWVGDFSEFEREYQYLRWAYADMSQQRGSDSQNSPPPLDDATRDQLRQTVICGSADDVVRQIAEFSEELGPEIGFIFRSYLPGLEYDRQRALVETLARDVIARLR